MLPNAISLGSSSCACSTGFCLAVVVCAFSVIGLFARSGRALLGFLLGSGTVRGSAAILGDDTRGRLAADLCCFEDAWWIMKPSVGRMLSTLKASTSATLMDGLESDFSEI